MQLLRVYGGRFGFSECVEEDWHLVNENVWRKIMV